MERLTKRRNGVCTYIGPRCMYPETGETAAEMDFINARTVLERLAAYEDTGLTPDGVKEHEAAYIEIMNRTYGPLHHKIAEWVKADEAGRLVVLPCKVGDTAYRVFTAKDREPVVVPCEIKTVGQAADLVGRIGKKGWMVSTYLTRQEAEAALREEADNG